jgi:DNA polymerase eta
MRDKDMQKVSLKFYRSESRKIFKVMKKHCELIEKASVDEAFLDITKEVNTAYEELQ